MLIQKNSLIHSFITFALSLSPLTRLQAADPEYLTLTFTVLFPSENRFREARDHGPLPETAKETLHQSPDSQIPLNNLNEASLVIGPPRTLLKRVTDIVLKRNAEPTLHCFFFANARKVRAKDIVSR